MSNLISQFIPPYPSFSVSTGPHFMSAFYSCPGTRFICTIFLDFHTHALIHDARSCSLTCVQLFATPGTIAHRAPLSRGLSRARILEWVAISSSKGSSWPRDRTCISCISCVGRQILYHWATWEAQDVVHMCNGIFLNHKKEQNWVICTDGPRICHTD